jgi:choline dehydrogenase-like flavoprotein
MAQNYDVIIIGSGAGGGTLARQLAPSGKNILILERGDWLKREAKNWDAEVGAPQDLSPHVGDLRRLSNKLGVA